MNMIAPRRRRLVVVGNGMAGMRAVEEILARAPDRYDITVFGAEPHANYNRIMLSPVLAGEKTLRRDRHQRPRLVRRERHRADRRRGGRSRSTATRSTVHGAQRHDAAATTGCCSRPARIRSSSPVPGHGPAGRDRLPRHRRCRGDDRRLPRRGGSAVVIGGGLLGLEAAYGLSRAAWTVTVVHLMPTLMERQLDAGRRACCSRDLEARGISVLHRRPTPRRSSATDRVDGVALEDGREIPADLVVMAVGIRPNIDAGARRRARLSTAASWSTTTCAPATRASTRSANASSIAGRSTAWSRRSGTWRRCCADAAHRRRPSGLCTGSVTRPGSRSPASTCSRPATSPAATSTRGDRASATPRAASTSGSCSRDDRVSARALRRRRATAPGTST